MPPQRRAAAPSSCCPCGNGPSVLPGLEPPLPAAAQLLLPSGNTALLAAACPSRRSPGPGPACAVSQTGSFFSFVGFGPFTRCTRPLVLIYMLANVLFKFVYNTVLLLLKQFSFLNFTEASPTSSLSLTLFPGNGEGVRGEGNCPRVGPTSVPAGDKVEDNHNCKPKPPAPHPAKVLFTKIPLRVEKKF